MKADINQVFDYIFYTYEEYFFVGPKREALPQTDNLSYPFDTPTWMFLYLSLIILALLALSIQFVNEVSLIVYDKMSIKNHAFFFLF